MTPKRILLHGGDWARKVLEAVAAGFSVDAELFFERHRPGDRASLLTRLFEMHFDSEAHTLDPPTNDEIESILRCRYLRSLTLPEAIGRLRAMRKAWADVLDQNSPECVIAQAIDSYVIESLERAAFARRIPFYGLVQSFLNGYCRATRYGEVSTSRKLAAHEVNDAVRLLSSREFAPAFVKANAGYRAKALRRYLRQLGCTVYYGARSLSDRGKSRNHVYGAYAVGLQNMTFRPIFSLGDKSWCVKAKNSNYPVMFVPLQMSPEATIDYWSTDLRLVNYEKAIVDFVRRQSTEFVVAIKEHPNLLGWRSPVLYNQLSEIDNVLFIPTTEGISSILPNVDVVAICTGTVGFQAAFAGTPVVCLSDVYFRQGRFFESVSIKDDPSRVINFISETQNRPITSEEKFLLVENLLKGLLVGRVDFGRAHSAPAIAQIEQCRFVGRQLSEARQLLEE